MKRMVLAFALVCLSCGTSLQPAAPPNLPPGVTAKFYATYAIKDLNVIRDFADDASKTTPPLITKATLLQVVNWHQRIVTVIHAAPDGWKTATVTGLDELQKGLPPSELQKFKPYIAAARAFVSEVR